MSRSKSYVVSKEHVCEALTGFLQALSIIDDDKVVTNFKKVPEGLEIKEEEETYD